MEVIMFVGIPASGKSTLANQYRARNYEVLSSDEIRLDLTQGEPLENHSAKDRKQLMHKVFSLIHSRCFSALKAGRSVVVDATNLGRKRRIQFLNQLSAFDCTKICALFITPVEVCLERNRSRTGFARVPEGDIHRMIRSFECPIPAEGWDVILPVVYGESYTFPFEAIRNFSQDNPHHSLTLDAHMASAESFCRSHGYGPILERVARFHDTGKLYTKRFENYRGEPTEIAHYYGHESCSALIYLAHMCCGKQPEPEAFRQILYEAALIGSHMRPLTMWKENPGTRQKDIALFGEEFIADLEKLHQADRAAH